MKKLGLRLFILIVMTLALCGGTVACSSDAKAADQDHSELSMISPDTPDGGLYITDATDSFTGTQEPEEEAEQTAEPAEPEDAADAEEITVGEGPADTEEPEEPAEQEVPAEPEEPAEPYLDPDGAYTSKDDVALYLYLYGELPQNFITKQEARELGWSGGALEPYAPGKSIGGDYFGNYEGQLPKRKGLTYHECDIDTMGKNSRGAKRIIYGTDGSIYYTGDHYESFEELYGGDD